MKNIYHKMMFKMFRCFEQTFRKLASWCNGVALRNQIKIERTPEEIAVSIKKIHDILDSE